MTTTDLDRKIQERMLLAPRSADRLVLGDATLRAALDGSRPLTPNERAALQASPLTLRRFRQLALLARTQARPARWESAGLLRAADSGGMLEGLRTDDGFWTLHFPGDSVIVQLDADAPFAVEVLSGGCTVRVRDGLGRVVLEGALDADGECERPWRFEASPAEYFQQSGARFTVQVGGG